MNIMVFDTETTGLTKPFCYDIGYIIVDTDTFKIVEKKHFIVEQAWHNLPLFESAYYKEKRPEYVKLMRQRKAVMDKYGYIMREIARDIRNYNITDAYAYNSDFDDNVFNFNCDWYKCNNPLETVAIHDIWGYASEFITNTADYKAFCEENQFFTDSNNYKSSAEVVYRFLMRNAELEEKHMGLEDCLWEGVILKYCVKFCGAEWGTDYKVKKILPRPQGKPITIKVNNKTIFTGRYIKKYERNDVLSITVAGE